MEKDYLTIKNLAKTYNAGTTSEIRALNDLSLSVSGGEFVTIVGSNAAGKTTLFNCIAGGVKQDSGSIILDQESITGLREFERAKFISRVRQNPNESVIRSMTLAENMAMAKLHTGRAGFGRGVTTGLKKEFTDLLAPFGLGLEKRLDDRADLLSGGQKQVMALIMAIIIHPKLLLLDEHTAALDPRVSELLLKMSDDLIRRFDITTLMVTHNISHAINFGSRLVLLDRGRVVFEARGEEKKRLTIADIVEKIEGHAAEFEEDIKV